MWIAFLRALAVCGATLFALCLLALFLHLHERWASRILARRLGWRSVLVTGWLGVSLHELSHLTMARLFGHRIIAWRLFSPDPQSGTLGYVHHSYSRRSAWQMLGHFFIGIAPLFAGLAALAGLLVWMLGPQTVFGLFARLEPLTSWQSAISGVFGLFGSLLEAIWQKRSPWLPLQIYLAACVALHMAPSRADMKNALYGVLFVLAAMIALSAMLAAFSISLEPLLFALPFFGVVLLVALATGGIYLATMVAIASLYDRATARA
jgi:hypothetical protein